MALPIFEAGEAVRVAQKAREVAYAELNTAQYAFDKAYSKHLETGNALDDAELTLMNAISEDSKK